MARLIESEKMDEDYKEESLRPLLLNDYIGQANIKEMLDIYLKAAKMRNEAMDHILLYGPPGLGKTTLAHIIANEMNANIKVTSGPIIERSGDLAAILSTLEPGDILFIDEIHRIPSYVEEVLYSAMEDFVLDIMIGKDDKARSIRIDLPPFTLIGATTRYGDLSSPLRERFGIVERLEFYNISELQQIIERTSRVYEYSISEKASLELAKRSRGTPRIANRLFRRLRDFSQVKNEKEISFETTNLALKKLHIDNYGLDSTDIRYLLGILEKFNGGPVGLETISAQIGEEQSTIEDVYEPYLLQEGFIKRTPRGRVITEKAILHLKNIGEYNESK